MGSSVLTDRTGLLERIAAEVGTPVYVYDAEAIRAQYRALDAALGAVPHRIFYSVKANSTLAVLSLMRGLGAGVDVVSQGEIERALSAGFAPADIVFSGVGKTRGELHRALELGIRLVNVESFAELELLDAVARDLGCVARFGIRVNPDVATETHPYTQTGEAGMKFGTPLDDVVPMGQYALRSQHLRLESVGMHIGSQILDAGDYREGASKLVALVSRLHAQGVDTVRGIDVGGGLGIRYTVERPIDPAAFAAAVTAIVGPTGLELAVEPGRFIVGNAGLLLVRCLYRKQAGAKRFAIVDAGMNDLLRPSLYGAVHDIVVVAPAGSDHGFGTDVVDVVGPVCESGDFFGHDRSLPGALPGALLAVMGAGAYGFTMSSNYNSRPRAAEVVVDGDRWGVIRRRESIEDLMRGERTLEDIERTGAWHA